MAQDRNTKTDPSEKKFIQIPGGYAQHAAFKDALWIKLVARELISQSTLNRGDITLGKIGTTFRFLAPEEIAETHNHQWDEYDSLQKRLLEKVKGFAKIGEEAGELKNLVMNSQKILEAGGRGANFSQRAQNVVNAAAGQTAGRVIHSKVDAPLVYINSTRREIQFTFDLPKLSETDSPMEAVQLIQQYAAPRIKGGNSIFINPPYIFQVTSEPPGLINYGYCALESVQPTWMTPYRFGEPLMCKLTLSFKDLSPLFASTIKKGSIITVRETTNTQRTITRPDAGR